MIDRSEILVRLGAYLEAANDEVTVWGVSDCTAWARRWVEEVRGQRMLLPIWRSRRAALKLIDKAGSLEALWEEKLDVYGMAERFEPAEPGDVGIIRTHAFPQVGGIFLNHGLFAWRAEPRGTRILLPKERTIVKVWALQ